MRRLLTICIVTMFAACSKHDNDSGVNNSSLTPAGKDSMMTKSAQTDNAEMYLTSTYDGSVKDLESHKASLKELSDSGVFSIIHTKLFSTLNKNHQAYFVSRPDFELLYNTPGDLFQNNKEDNAFIVYDKKYSRVSILVYDELKNSYSELFRSLKVKDGLETADCNYGSFGTLDYQIADELIYQRDYLMKKPESHLEYSKCKIVDISKDEIWFWIEVVLQETFRQTRNLHRFVFRLVRFTTIGNV